MRNKRIILSGELVVLFGCCLFGAILWYILFRPIKEEAWPSWSPDGRRLAYECYINGPTSEIAEWNGTHYTEEAADICIVDADGRDRVHLVRDRGGDHYPVWSPNGSQIAYIRRDGIYVINADGTKQRRLVHLPPGKVVLVHINKVTWSPDGKHLVFAGCLSEDVKQKDIYRVDVSDGTLTNLTRANDRQDFDPNWTLNGTKIVFLSIATPLREDTCYLDNPVSDDATYQTRIMSIDGSDESIVYDSKTNQPPFIAASTIGKIAFANGPLDSSNLRLIDLTEADSSTEIDDLASGPMSWVPNQPWLLLYRGAMGFTILNVETGGMRRTLPPPPIDHTSFNPYTFINSVVWSPDGKQIAVTTGVNPTGFYQEKQIYIFDLQTDIYRPLIQ